MPSGEPDGIVSDLLDEILADALGGSGLVGGDRNRKVDLVCLAELIAPCQESFSLSGIAGLGDLVQAVDEDMGNIVITGMEAADEALQIAVATDGIVACFHETDTGFDIIDQLRALFDADHVAGFAVNSGVNKIDHLLGFAGAH